MFVPQVAHFVIAKWTITRAARRYNEHLCQFAEAAFFQTFVNEALTKDVALFLLESQQEAIYYALVRMGMLGDRNYRRCARFRRYRRRRRRHRQGPVPGIPGAFRHKSCGWPPHRCLNFARLVRLRKDIAILKTWVSSFCLIALLSLGACTTRKTSDVSDNVRKSLNQAGFKDVSVSQDRDKGVLNLTGHVATESDKAQAEAIAKANARGQVVADEIAVLPVNDQDTAKTVYSDHDAAIKKDLDAALTENRLSKNVKYSVKNGVVKLTGKVDSHATRSEAAKIATSIPNVQQVVNELEVKYRRETSSK